MRKLLSTGPSIEVLHRDYAARGRIDEAAPITSSSGIVIDAPVERVWEVLADLRGWAAWHGTYELKELGEVRPGERFRWKIRGASIRSTFAIVDPGRELTWTGVAYGAKAVDQHLLEPVEGGRTRVTVAESLSGPFITLLYSAEKLRAGHQEWLSDLKKHIEGSTS
jgi:uncharacterized protein YndB with AHSA1/START domain